jgi:ribosomal subunit interface protein
MKAFDINNIQLKVQSPGVELDDELSNFIIRSLEKLGKTFGNITGCEMMLKNEKDSKKMDCEVEAKIFVPGNVLFASAKNSSFRLASGLVFDDLHDQLYKYKEKLKAIDRSEKI